MTYPGTAKCCAGTKRDSTKTGKGAGKYGASNAKKKRECQPHGAVTAKLVGADRVGCAAGCRNGEPVLCGIAVWVASDKKRCKQNEEGKQAQSR